MDPITKWAENSADIVSLSGWCHIWPFTILAGTTLVWYNKNNRYSANSGLCVENLFLNFIIIIIIIIMVLANFPARATNTYLLTLTMKGSNLQDSPTFPKWRNR
jgi:hypothetical protein